MKKLRHKKSLEAGVKYSIISGKYNRSLETEQDKITLARCNINS